jgi:hypothetical protein
MSFMGLLVRRAFVLGGIGAVGYGAWWAFDNLYLTPTKRVFEMNRGERVWDPLAEGLKGPVASDEGFVCPGATLYGSSTADLQVTRTLKLKVIKKTASLDRFDERTGDAVLVVKVFGGVDINDPKAINVPVFRIYSKDFRKALPCPARPAQP